EVDARVPAGHEQKRTGERALGLKRVQVELPRLRLVANVLDDNSKLVGGAGVGEIDGFDRILEAGLRVGTPRDHGVVALANKVQVVVVRRSAVWIVPGQDDLDFAIRRQRDQVIRLRPQGKLVRRVEGRLKLMQMPSRVQPRDAGAVDSRIDV